MGLAISQPHHHAHSHSLSTSESDSHLPHPQAALAPVDSDIIPCYKQGFRVRQDGARHIRVTSADGETLRMPALPEDCERMSLPFPPPPYSSSLPNPFWWPTSSPFTTPYSSAHISRVVYVAQGFGSLSSRTSFILLCSCSLTACHQRPCSGSSYPDFSSKTHRALLFFVRVAVYQRFCSILGGLC